MQWAARGPCPGRFRSRDPPGGPDRLRSALRGGAAFARLERGPSMQHLQSNKLDDVSRVTVCTIQRLYSMLRGEELPEDADELSTYEIGAALIGGSGVPPLGGKSMRQDAASTKSLNRQGSFTSSMYSWNR